MIAYRICLQDCTPVYGTVVCSCTRMYGVVYSCTGNVYGRTQCMYIVESALFVDVHELEVYRHR